MSEASIGTVVNPVSRRNPGGGDEDIGPSDDDRKWAVAAATDRQRARADPRPRPECRLVRVFGHGGWSRLEVNHGAVHSEGVARSFSRLVSGGLVDVTNAGGVPSVV